MAQEFISEYGLPPADYAQRLTDTLCEYCPDFSKRAVEEAFLVDDGPIDYLVWFVLEDYNGHTFYYRDKTPDKEFLHRLAFMSPSRAEMPTFKQYLQNKYDVYRELEIAKILELTDTYQPQLGTRPRANFCIGHDPGDDRIVFGISGTPRPKEQEIFDNIDKIVPDNTVEQFISRTVQTVNTRIEEEADRHTISSDIRDRLKADSNFQKETTKPLPTGIHPKYTDQLAQLWQKPASKVEYMNGSQGFLQIWIPVDETDVTLVSATAGDYNREAIVDTIREEYQATTA